MVHPCINLFITSEGEFASTEGTIQGDLLAMAMYALAVTPLIASLHHHRNVSQAWFADDATAAGQLIPLSYMQWWKQLLSLGPLTLWLPS